MKQELLLCGSYDWFPKRRDVIAFARDYAAVADRLPIVADDLPLGAVGLLPYVPSSERAGSAIRFGLITDRFVAGHKLKTGYYLANNAIVLSFADVTQDFANIPDHDFFIPRVGDAREIGRHVAAVAAEEPRHLRPPGDLQATLLRDVLLAACRAQPPRGGLKPGRNRTIGRNRRRMNNANGRRIGIFGD